MSANMRFQRLGGFCQLIVEEVQDLYFIPELNEELWSMTSARTDAFRCDPEFLKFLDADANGRIRVDEVKAAVRWLLSLLGDPSGIIRKDDVLAVEAVNRKNPEGREIYRTIRIALANLGIPDSPTISLAQISDQKNIIADALQNGDGVIPPGSVQNPRAAECIRMIMASIGKQTDRSGAEGIGMEELARFREQASALLAWNDEAKASAQTIFPFGEKTAGIYGAFLPLAEKIDAFFKNCEALSLSECAGNARFAVCNTLDPMDDSSVSDFLSKAPVAPVDPDCVLDLDKVCHPEWKKAIRAFFSSVPGAPEHRIPADYWYGLRARLASYGAWIAKKPETGLHGRDPELLRSLLSDGTLAYLDDLIRRDLEVNRNLENCAQVRKLILYQKNMLEFLNNFVTLDRLFDNSKPSMIQAGRLVMDGRTFNLCSVVTEPAMHKKIAQESNICVMYLDAATGIGAAAKKIKLAVAVTSGHMRNLFIGKCGLFYAGDGTVWDATVFDFIQQPVSIPEALKMPFYKFADFLQKQADRFFSARSKQYEDAVAKDIQSKAALPTPGSKPAAPPPQQQTPAVSGSMILMGGGVGIAAIGSAFAFMAKSIQGVSIGSVLAILLGILLIFGGPIILISLCKLFHRKLSMFFEANGFALNGQMRLSLKMGHFFTYTPSLPGRVKVFPRQILAGFNTVESLNAERRRKITLVFLLVLLILEIAAVFLLKYWNEVVCLWNRIF